MKISGAKKVHYDSGPNMTPLVDVVMVILIFLMLAGSFGATERYLISDVPVAEKGTGGKTDKDVPLKSKIDIQVSQDGPFYTAKVDKFQPVTSRDAGKAYDTVYAYVKQKLGDYTAASIKPEDVQVTIYPTSPVTMDNLVVIYQAALDAGCSKVGFGVTPGK